MSLAFEKVPPPDEPEEPEGLEEEEGDAEPPEDGHGQAKAEPMQMKEARRGALRLERSMMIERVSGKEREQDQSYLDGKRRKEEDGGHRSGPAVSLRDYMSSERLQSKSFGQNSYKLSTKSWVIR